MSVACWSEVNDEERTWHSHGWLIINADFEASGTPIDELNCTFGFDSSNGCVDVLGHNITTVEQTASHVFA